MSVDAVAYVLKLTVCPDGAELDPAKKCVLFCLADHHNRSTRRCEPSIPLLVEESLQSRASVMRQLDYLERHCVVERRKPHGVGSGKLVNFVFLAIDDMDRLAAKLTALREGSQLEPLFSPQVRVSEGSQISRKRVSEGSQIGTRNKEESGIKSNRVNHACAPVSKPVEMLTWKALPDGLQQKVLRELRSMREANVGRAMYDGDKSAEQIAAYERDLMLKACQRAEIWNNRAVQIADEFYQAALHEEAQTRNRQLQEGSHGDTTHA